MPLETADAPPYPETAGSSRTEVLHTIAAACITFNILLSPWAFGSWEMWWFWPLAACIFAGCFFSGTATLIRTVFADSSPDRAPAGRFTLTARILGLLATLAPFLLYAFIRARFPSGPDRPLVAMDAERSLLLFVTPVLIGLVLFLSFTRRQLRLLFAAIIINAVILALYAGINQWLTYGENKPDYVLWVLTPWGYGDRAKGPFFCPNHLSAYLNLALCLCTAILFTPHTPLRTRLLLLAATVMIATTNFMTLSRGGLASLLIGLFFGIPLLAMRGHRLRGRLLTPLLVLVVAIAGITVITRTANPLMARIQTHPLYRTATTDIGSPEWWSNMHDTFWYRFDRGTYIQSALRAWKSNPVWGIGPGQHASRWPEFAATDDGVRPADDDPASFKKPRLSNSDYHLYEVHSDWTQLLEESGIVGLILFLIPLSTLFILLLQAQGRTLARAQVAADAANENEHTAIAPSADDEAPPITRRRSSRRRHHRSGPSDRSKASSQIESALPLAASLATLVLIIHSTGDFSLQIPAVTWLFSAMLAGGVLSANETHSA